MTTYPLPVALRLAAHLLPRAHRDRYRCELAAELHDVPQGERAAYTRRALVRVGALRAALRDQSVSTIGEAVMSKPLRCRLGLHRWYAEYNDDDEPYKACARCNAAEEHFGLGDANSGAAFGGPSGTGW